MINPVSSAVSNRIRNMSFVCACLVVAIHITRHVVRGSGAWWLFAIGSETICRVAVPFFLLVSGFLVAGHFDEPHYWMDALKKRVRTLLVPYLLVGSAYVLFQFILARRFGYVSMIDLFGLNLFGVPRLGVLWYLRMLILLIAGLPVVRAVVINKKLGGYLSLLLFVVWCLFSPWTGGDVSPMRKFFIYGISIEGIAFFVLGAYFRLHPIVLKFKFWMVLIAMLGVCVVRIYALWRGFECQHVVLHITIPIVMLLVWLVVPARVFQGGDIITFSMPIYLLHKFLILVVAAGLRKATVYSYCESTAGGYLMLYLLVLSATMIVCVALRRYFSCAYKIMTGGR